MAVVLHDALLDIFGYLGTLAALAAIARHHSGACGTGLLRVSVDYLLFDTQALMVISR